MRAAGLLGLAMLAAGCVHGGAPAEFSPALLAPTSEDAEPVVLTGWLQVETPTLLYPDAASYRAGTKSVCVAISPLSMAGVVTSNYEGRRMAVTGRIEHDADSACGTQATIMASDISEP